MAARTLHVPAQQAEEAATREADATARQAVADRIRSARQARWLELRATAEPLLSALASGTADPADPAVQRACAVEAARLRRRLFAEADDTPDPLVHELHACARSSRSGAGWRWTSRPLLNSPEPSSLRRSSPRCRPEGRRAITDLATIRGPCQRESPGCASLLPGRSMA